jgi:hypothetical protein
MVAGWPKRTPSDENFGRMAGWLSDMVAGWPRRTPSDETFGRMARGSAFRQAPWCCVFRPHWRTNGWRSAFHPASCCRGFGRHLWTNHLARQSGLFCSGTSASGDTIGRMICLLRRVARADAVRNSLQTTPAGKPTVPGRECEGKKSEGVACCR